MMKLSTIATSLAFAAAHTRSTYDASEFKSLGRAARNARLTFTAALPTSNFGELDAVLADISDPTSVNYGQWLSQDEVNELTAPAPEVRAEVAAWMAKHGAECLDWPTSLRCTATAEQVEKMFNTKVSTYETEKGKVIHRVHPTEKMTFPAELTGKLRFVTNVFDFPTKRMRYGSGVASHGPSTKGRKLQTDYMVALETLWSFYGVNKLKGSEASTTAPAEFQADQAITRADQKAFAENNGVAMWNITHKTGSFSGSDTEATLDGEYIAGVGVGNAQWWWTEADWMYEWTEALKAAAELPSVFSVSWGWSEADQCTVDPSQGPCTNPDGSAAYVAAVNEGLAAATARGVSILVASGDSGAHGRTDPGCSSSKTLPDFPTASPYILAVGATQISNGKPIASPTTGVCKTSAGGAACAGSGTEIVASTATGALIVSGGGFSNVAAQPAWQAAAVKKYLASGAKLPGAGNFNASGRAYPDVAALGHNVVIYQSGPEPVDGTSCSAPIFAGVIGLANSERLAAGKKVLGFVNPAIYQVASATTFTDVVTGDNSCTEQGCVSGCTGYGATVGWDATTGWGTPKAEALVAALAALP